MSDTYCWWKRPGKGFLTVAVAVTLLTAGAPRAAEQPLETPPVRKVVLYKHGMGYIERQGKVKETATLALAFRTDQMKDLLKSFYAVDLGGGRIVSVRYETKDPLARQLSDILISVPENAALSQFLPQLKGARIIVRAAGESVEGRILGLEPVSEIVGGQTVRQGYRLVILTDAGPIRSVDLMSIGELTLADELLQKDLRRLLDISLDSKYTNRKKLLVTAEGKGEREVRIGYLVEMPIWKASYRVILDPKEKEQSLLQGWAQAENTTEDDWKDVAVSFVAGSPLAYVMDLYSPLYVKRPQVPVPGLQDLAVDWGQAAPPETAGRAGSIRAEGKAAKAPMMSAMAAPMVNKKEMNAYANVAQSLDQESVAGGAPPEASLGDLMNSSVGTAAQGTKVGELFSYEAQGRITIPRGQAALVPIVSRPMGGKRVVYYKAAFSPRAVDAWVLRNDTDLTLEAGAVTFFEGSTSLGEGILGHTLPPGSQEVVAYALDASVDVNPQVKADRQPYFRGKMADGILTLTRGETLATSWKIVNRGKEPATFWLNQPKNVNYQLSKPEKPLKEVDNHYRFEIILKPGETRDFAVEEKRDVEELVDVGSADSEQIRFFAAEKYLAPAVRTFLGEVGEIMSRKASFQRQINEWQNQVSRLAEEENRLRQNVNTTNFGNTPSEKDLRAKWMVALSAAEDKLTQLRGSIDETGGRMRQLEEELAAKIRAFKEN